MKKSLLVALTICAHTGLAQDDSNGSLIVGYNAPAGEMAQLCDEFILAGGRTIPTECTLPYVEKLMETNPSSYPTRNCTHSEQNGIEVCIDYVGCDLSGIALICERICWNDSYNNDSGCTVNLPL